MMQPVDNRHLLNTVNRASDPDYYGSDNRSVLNAVNRTNDPEYYGSQGSSGAGSYQFGELGSGSFGIGMPVSDQVLAMAEEARGGRILTQMRDAEIDASRTYTVRSGQTLSGITGRNDPAYLDQLAQYNGLASRHDLRAGQALQLPDDATLAGVVVSPQVADRGAAGAAYFAQRQAATLQEAAQASTNRNRVAEVVGYADGYPALAQDIRTLNEAVANRFLTPEQAEATLMSLPRANMTLRSDYTEAPKVNPNQQYVSAWDGVQRESAMARMDREARAPGANRIENQVGPVIQPFVLAVIPGGQYVLGLQGSHQLGEGFAQIQNGETLPGTLNVVGGGLQVFGSGAALLSKEFSAARATYTAETGGANNVIATASSGQLAKLLPTSSLSARQVAIHEQLSSQGAVGSFAKKSVSMADLRAIGQVTGDEYSMFTLGAQRTVIRGYRNEISVSQDMLDDLVAGSYGRWSGHTHPPGYSINPGPADRPFLQQMGQQRSAIWGNDGQHVYGRLPSDDAMIQSEIMRAQWARIYGGN